MNVLGISPRTCLGPAVLGGRQREDLGGTYAGGSSRARRPGWGDSASPAVGKSLTFSSLGKPQWPSLQLKRRKARVTVTGLVVEG